MAEFDALTKQGTEQQCARWIEKHMPDHRVTVATVRADLIAEVVRTVSAADPATVRGNRQVREVMKASIEGVAGHFDDGAQRFQRTDGEVRVHIDATDDQPGLVITITVPDDATLLTVSSAVPLVLTGPAAANFVVAWNMSAPLPKAVVVEAPEVGRQELVGEVVTQLPARVTRVHLDRVIDQSIARVCSLFRTARASGLL
jgi:hypothetical protein